MVVSCSPNLNDKQVVAMYNSEQLLINWMTAYIMYASKFTITFRSMSEKYSVSIEKELPPL